MIHHISNYLFVNFSNIFDITRKMFCTEMVEVEAQQVVNTLVPLPLPPINRRPLFDIELWNIRYRLKSALERAIQRMEENARPKVLIY